MPDEDGYDLIRQIRTLDAERGGRITALALTAYARIEDREAALSAGYQQHAGKPIEPAELAAVVASLADRGSAERPRRRARRRGVSRERAGNRRVSAGQHARAVGGK